MADYLLLQSDARRIPLPDQSVSLVIGSPPYIDARLYLEDGKDLGISLDCADWIEWMLGITAESLRVSRGLVLWVVAGVTRGRNYQPGPEGLLYRWWAQGGECHCLRPVIWHRGGIPGSGGDEWFRADTEYALAFKRPGKLPWADNTANGQPPKWNPGGTISYRLANGKRVNTSKTGSRRRQNGNRESQIYIPPDISNPGNIFHTGNGGGQLGSPLAHLSEAPYPIDVPAWFIASHCPPSTCSVCGFPLRFTHENKELPPVQQTVSNPGYSPRPQQVLQPRMLETLDDKTEGGLRGVRESDSTGEIHTEAEILLTSLLKPVDRKEQEDDQRTSSDAAGICPHSQTRTPDVDQERICDGTSNGDGGSPEKTIGTERSSSSQERTEGRQSHGESGIDDQTAARFSAETKKSDRVSVLRSRHRENSVCPSCGADLTGQEAIKPGLVLDPFSGSGTTADAALSLGRRAIGLDIRRSQCELGHRRIADSLRPVSRYDPPPPLTPLPGQGDLFSYLQDQS